MSRAAVVAYLADKVSEPKKIDSQEKEATSDGVRSFVDYQISWQRYRPVLGYNLTHQTRNETLRSKLLQRFNQISEIYHQVLL
jgi:hypothetical protein